MARPIRYVLVAICVAVMPPQVRALQTTTPGAVSTSLASCQVSEDPEFAVTPAKAARVGGGAMYVAARQRRYLDALRGPDGQQITYKRLGQARVPGKDGILDHYQVTYEGLTAQISLYLDAYHFDEPKAPQGFTCVAFTVGPPPVDGFLATDLMVRLAIEQGASREFAPISLDADGSAAHGVAFDRFRMIARAARAAAASGTPLDPKNLPGALSRASLILLAYPLKCGERGVAPASIEIVPPQGAPVRREGDIAVGDALRKLVPDLSPPAGTIGATFGLGALRPIDTVRITYADEVCSGGTKEVMLPTRYTAAKAVSTTPAALPAGMTPPSGPVWLQVVVDFDGALQQAAYIGGPESHLEQALAAIRQWKAEPARVNGSPVIADTVVVVRFR